MAKAKTKSAAGAQIKPPSISSPAISTSAIPKPIAPPSSGKPSLVSLFIDHLRIDKGSSPHTLQAYARDLAQFGATDEFLIAATEANVQLFLKNLKSKEQKSTSIARKVSALKQFYKFLIQENLIAEDPTLFIEAPLRATKLPKALSTESITALLKAADTGLAYDGKIPPKIAMALKQRDRAMIYLLYATGVRVTELLTITLPKLDIESGYIRVLGKRSKERIIPFAPIAGELLHLYLNEARPLLKPGNEFLFLGLRGEPLTRQAFWGTLKKIAVQAEIPQALHPHMLRHTFATDLLKSGMNLRSLQSLLGHADLQTTEIYTHVAPEKLAEVIKKYHPRGSK
jgi:integrase/recombinase XerD